MSHHTKPWRLPGGGDIYWDRSMTIGHPGHVTWGSAMGMGQLPSTTTTPLLSIAMGIFVLAVLGGAFAEKHQRSLHTNKQRKKRSHTRFRRRGRASARRLYGPPGDW